MMMMLLAEMEEGSKQESQVPPVCCFASQL